MADVSGKFFSAKKVRTGVSPSSPGVEQGETLPPVNPPGSDLNSVGLSMPSAFNVANTPLTSNGTIAVTGAGTTAQYIRGDGSLASFPSLTGYVPYTGATQNVDLGEFGLDTGFVNLDTTPTNTPTTQGTMYWDDSRSTAALIMNGTLQHIGQDTFFYVKNSTGSSIAKGTAVRFDGTDGASGHLLIAPFLANGTYPSNYFMGVTAETIANGSFGQVMHFGELSGINTSGYTAGALLYASTTVAGGFQTTAPVAPNNIVLIAAAINSKNNGEILVRPTYGSNINQDEGVKIVSPTTGQLLQLQSNGLWENKTKAQVLGGTSSQFVKGDGSLDSTTYQSTAEKGQPNGYASLDGNGKVPLAQINDALIGNVNYQGLWNAATNNPTLANPPSSGTKGYYYIVSTAGTFAGISFEVGDWIISNGSAWQKVDNTDAVSSVFGRTGNVIAANGDYNTSQVTESTNLYYTEARVNANANVAANTAARHNAVTLGTANGLSLSTQQLSLQLASGSQNGALSSTDWTTFNNKENAITAGTTAQYFRGDKTFQTLNTAAVPESGNLYFTNARAIASVLTGYTSGAGTISASDSILSAIQKLNGNIGALVTGVSSVNGQTGAVTLTTSNIAEGTNLYFTQARVSANTDVAANTAARHNAVTLGTANGLSLNTQQLSLGLASAGVTGALSGTDWSTFNSKQQALNGTGFVKISGTTISYDNSTYLTTAAAASTYLPLAGGTMTGQTLAPSFGSDVYGGAYHIRERGYVLSTESNWSFSPAITFHWGDRAVIRFGLRSDGLMAIDDQALALRSWVQSQSYLTGNQTITLSGDATGSGATAITVVLANSGVTSGTYNDSATQVRPFTVDSKGRITSIGTAVTITPNWANISGQRTLTRNDAGLQGDAGARSGFFETDSPVNYYSGASSWQHLIESRHTNDSNNYAMQIAGSFFDQEFYVRKTNNSATTAWSKLWHSGNITPVTGTGTSGQVAFFNGTSSITGESNLFWDATNDRLGIGTASPATRLHIANSSSAVLFAQDGTTATIVGADAAGSSSQGLFLRGFPLTFTGNGGGSAAQMTLNSSGNLGLGVTPSAWNLYKAIQVQNASISNFDNSDNSIVGSNVFYGGSPNDFRYISTGTSTVYRLNNSVHSWFIAPLGTAGDAISFTQAMTLGSNSGLSIGTPSAAPSQGLLVQGASTFSSSVTAKGDLFIWGGNAAQAGQITANSAGGGLYFGASGTNQNIRLVPSGTGIVQSLGSFDVQGAATFSSSLETNGRILITADAGNEQLIIRRASNTNEQLIFGFHSLDYARIQALEQGVAYRPLALNQDGGNVLIGTTTDAGFKLDVNGTGRFSGDLTHAGASATSILNIYTIGGTTYNFSGVSGAANSIINGSVLGDTVIRTINKSILFSTNNGSSSALIINTSGNVGIGTTSPQRRLDVFTFASSATEYQLSLRNGAGANNVSTGIAFGFNSQSFDPDYLSAISSIITNRTTRAADLTFLTAATGTLVERMRITSGGNVLIGKTNDRLRLTVSGSDSNAPTLGTASGTAIFANNAGSTEYGMNFGVASTGYGWIQQHRFDGTSTVYPLVLQPSGGNVIIGTSTSIGASILQVTGDARISNVLLAGGAANIDSSLAVQISTTGSGTQKWFGANKNGGYGLIIGYSETTGLSGVGAYIRQVTSDPLFFVVNNTTTALTLASTGAATFSSSVTATGGLISNGGSIGYGGGELGFNVTTSGATSGIYTTATGSPILYFDHRATGNTGFWVWRSGTGGGTTALTLSNAGAATFSSSVTATSFIPSGSTIPTNGMYLPSANTIAFSTNTVERMRIISTGGVGIGTDTPASLLHVRGTGEVFFETNSNTFDPALRIQKSRGTAPSRNIVANEDYTGSITFEAYNGTSYSQATGILGQVNGTVSTGITPTDLIFSAGPSGTTRANERMRIFSSGNVRVGSSAFGDSGDVLRVGGNTYTQNIITFQPGNVQKSVPWKLGAAATGTVNPNRLIRVEVDGISYDLVARQII